MEGRGRNLLVGCGAGCLAVVMLGIAGCVGVTVWLRARGELLEPELLSGPDATGYVEWTLSLDDPGTAGFVEAFFERTGSMAEGQLPDVLEWLVGMQQRRQRRQLRRTLPAVVAWTLLPGEEESDHHLLSVSMAGGGNNMVVADSILSFVLRRSEEGRVEPYRGERLYQFPPDEEGDRPWFFFLRRGEMHFASDRTAAERAVDRLTGEGEEAAMATIGASEVAAWFAALPAERSLRGAVSNRRGELGRLQRLLTGEGDEPPFEPSFVEELVGLTLAASLTSEVTLEGELELVGPSPAWAIEQAAALTRRREAGELPEWVEEGWTWQARRERLRIDFVVQDLFEEIEDGRIRLPAEEPPEGVTE